jgi:hypothetical protein
MGGFAWLGILGRVVPMTEFVLCYDKSLQKVDWTGKSGASGPDQPGAEGQTRLAVMGA